MTPNNKNHPGFAIHDPAAFAVGYLNRRIWAKQREIARSVLNNPLTAVKGCHASGKSYISTGLPLWWLSKYRKAKALNTAPTLRQVKNFWSEINAALAQSRIRFLFPDPTTTGLKVNDELFAVGASSSHGVNMAGFHSPNVLIIIDEAPGVTAEIFDAIEGIRAGGNVRLLILGNPIIPAGNFYDAFHRGRRIWNCISISAFDTPNLAHEVTGEPLTIEDLMTMTADRLAYCPFPALITRTWVKERYITWGPTHPQYMSRVLAQFPTQANNAVFALQWIEQAKRDPTEKELKEALRRKLVIQVAIDVAGEGSDETVLVARVGGMILETHAWADPDPRGAVVRILGRLKHHPLYRLGIVVVDTVGIGYNFALHLADNGFDVFGFKAGARAVDSAQFANQKAEATFQFREWLKGGYVSGLGTLMSNDVIVPEEETEAQLATMLYRETGRGIIEIIPKDEMKQKHGVQSPDRAEALIMAFMRIMVAEQQVQIDAGEEYGVISPI